MVRISLSHNETILSNCTIYVLSLNVIDVTVVSRRLAVEMALLDACK